MAPAVALADGMIHESVGTIEELVPRAKAWILENKDNADAAVQPWDRKGHRIPGGDANSPKLAQLLMMSPAMLRRCANLVAGRIPLEASGNITLDNISEVAATGVDFISMGAVTHSAKALDLSLRFL